MHTRVRDVVPRPTRPHGHCQLGVTRIICAIILDNRRHRLVVNEENLHTMPLVTVYMVSPAPLFPSQGRRTNAYLTGRCEGGEGGAGRKSEEGDEELQKRTPIAAITPHDIDVSPYTRRAINFHCIHRRIKTGPRRINNSEIGRII